MTAGELTKQIGVSPAAIPVVLNRKRGASEGIRKKALDAVKTCRYTSPARRPKNDKNVFLVKYCKDGMLVEENQGFIPMIIDSIEEQLRTEQLSVVMTVVKASLKSALDSIGCSRYYGMLLTVAEVMWGKLSAPDSIPIPFVVVDNIVPSHYCSSVCMNNVEDIHIAFQYCKECEHTRLGYPGGTMGAENFNERHVAFLRYAKELSFQFNPKNEFRVKPTMLRAHSDLFRILDQDPVLPSYFFAENDTTALGAMEVLKEEGYKIPNSVPLISFDDIPYSFISSPTLTTIHVQRKIMGKQSVTQLIQLIEGPRFMFMKTQIVGKLAERSSVKHLV